MRIVANGFFYFFKGFFICLFFITVTRHIHNVKLTKNRMRFFCPDFHKRQMIWNAV